MERLCRRALSARTRVNGIMGRRQAVESLRCQRTISTTTISLAKRSRHTKPKTAERKAFEYKTPTRRPNITAPPSEPAPKANPLRGRGVGVGAVIALLLGGGVAYLAIIVTRTNFNPVSITPSDQEDVSARYDSIANTFDAEIDSTEYWMGIKKLRKKIAAKAHGDVLEVSIGTGRNLEFYDWNFKGHGGVGMVDSRGYLKRGKVRSLTAVDKSEEMLEVAHQKFGKMFPGILGVRWIIADAAESGKIPGPPRNANERSGSLEAKYDTVVQTFGLCSVKNPVGLLKNLGDCVKEEEGRILLLEHGRGKWKWLNNALDNSAEGHAKAFGCWWNRDMRQIVNDSGLEVVEIETPKWWHGGTTWWIELKKPKSITENKGIETKAVQPALLSTGQEGGSASPPPTKSWWR